jgi:hypothetical protein
MKFLSTYNFVLGKFWELGYKKYLLVPIVVYWIFLSSFNSLLFIFSLTDFRLL